MKDIEYEMATHLHNISVKLGWLIAFAILILLSQCSQMVNV